MKMHPAYHPVIGLAAMAMAAMACLQTQRPEAAAPTIPPIAYTVTALAAQLQATSTATLEAAAPATATGTAEPTSTASPTPSSTPSVVSVLKGTVVQLSNCRYGPGAFFLYKIGMKAGAPIEAVGRTIDGGWAYIQYAGTHNLCWINSKQLQLDGDIMSLQDYYPSKAPLPMTSKFPAASILSVSGGGASITVDWTPVVLPDIAMPGGAGETEYVVEVWSCKNGAPGYYTYGTNETSLTFEVDDSCGMISRANLISQNKLGIAGVMPISLP